jgi:serine phosphatase RsbU (regulator of sigma subunit)
MMYSDGFTEAIDTEGKEFGQDQLVETFENACSGKNSLEEVVDIMARRIIDYEDSQSDDQTLVLIRRN